MGLLKRHSQHHRQRQEKPTAELHFTYPGSKQTRQWTTSDTISGTATFRFPSTIARNDLRATLLLRGTITTSTNESAQGSLQPNWRTQTMKFLSVGRETQLRPPFQRSRTSDHEDEVEVPFAFPLEEVGRMSTLDAGLPLSLDSRTTAGREQKAFSRRDSKVQYEISYSLTAALYSSDARGALASTTEKLQILPVGQPEPPSYGSLDVAGEFFTARARTSSRARLTGSLGKRGTGGQIDLVAQEPAPLVLDAGGRGAEAATKIEMLVKLTSDSASALEKLPTQAHIHTTLTSTTHIFPNGEAIQRERKPNERLSDPDAQTRISKSAAQECALQIPGWEIIRPDGEDGFAVARVGFLYRHRQGELCPSFATAVLERRYGLEVKVEFSGEGESAGQSVVVTLPLRVGYEVGGGRRAEDDKGGVSGDEDARLARKLSVESDVFEIPNDRAVAAAT